MPRYWGYWTVGKLDLLRRYVHAFNTASSSLDERVYLDLFGGQPENLERGTNQPVDGSARIALLDDRPGFTKLRFFEMEPNASQLRTALNRDFNGRDFEVITGDCNETLDGALGGLVGVNWAPTFAFVDPNGPDIRWSTLEALSRFRRGKTKTEIWMLLAAGLFIRNLKIDGNVRDRDAANLDALYGTAQWRAIYEARIGGLLGGARARDEYVNLMRWRLERVLGYKWAHPLEIFNERGHSIYHMIFATDHPVGTKIMTDLYTRALSEFPTMREAARLHAWEPQTDIGGQTELFGRDVGKIPDTRPDPTYVYTAPSEPYGSIND